MGERDDKVEPAGKKPPEAEVAEESAATAPGEDEETEVVESPAGEEEPAAAGDQEEDVLEPEVIEPGGEDETEVQTLIEQNRELTDVARKLDAQLQEVQSRLRAVSKGYRELQEEMRIFRSRTEQRADAKVHQKLGALLQSFFEPVMNLRRALENRGEDLESFGEGIEMVLGQFMAVLERHGFEEVPGEGAEFDPEVHEALAVMPVTEPEQDGKVLAVHNTGYRLGGRVIQAAQVVIGKYQEPAEA